MKHYDFHVLEEIRKQFVHESELLAEAGASAGIKHRATTISNRMHRLIEDAATEYVRSRL